MPDNDKQKVVPEAEVKAKETPPKEKKEAAKKEAPAVKTLGLDWAAIGAKFDAKYDPGKGLQNAGRVIAKIVVDAIKAQKG